MNTMCINTHLILFRLIYLSIFHSLLMVTLAKLQEIIEKREEETNGGTGSPVNMNPQKLVSIEMKESPVSVGEETTILPSIDAAATATAAAADNNADTTGNIKQDLELKTASSKLQQQKEEEEMSVRASRSKAKKGEQMTEKGAAEAASMERTQPAYPSTTSMDAYLGQDLIIPNNTLVAARISGTSDSDEEEMWIKANVLNYIPQHKKYEVEDVDIEESSKSRKRYKLPRKYLIPLSKDFSEHTPFKKGTQVLAMYPDTTTFYPAIVHSSPSPSNNYTYQVKFEDDQDDTGRTPARKVSYKHVVAIPEKQESDELEPSSRSRGGKQQNKKRKKR
jgi:SAGA-associated factor 29